MKAHLNPSWLLVDIRDGLRGQPGRTILAGLAIAVGVLALTLLLSSLMGLQQKSHLMIQELGANMVAVLPSGRGTDGAAGLQPHHQAILQDNLPHHLVSGVKRYLVNQPDLKTRLHLIATDSHFGRVRPFNILQGRFLDPVDVQERQPVCLISQKLAQQQGLKLDQVFRLPPLHLRVVGIVSVEGDALRSAADNGALSYGDFFVVIPGSIAPLWETPLQAPSPALDTLFIQCPPDNPPDQTVRRVQELLQAEARQIGSLSYITPATLVRGIRKLQRTLQLTTGSISVLCLVLGGTTLMSLMIANVRERIGEIGLRVSLGASAMDIYGLFIIEAIITTVLAALLGSGAAHLLLVLVREHIAFPVYLGWATILVPVVTALGLAVLFSYGPARYAANISPATALRNE